MQRCGRSPTRADLTASSHEGDNRELGRRPADEASEQEHVLGFRAGQRFALSRDVPRDGEAGVQLEPCARTGGGRAGWAESAGPDEEGLPPAGGGGGGGRAGGAGRGGRGLPARGGGGGGGARGRGASGAPRAGGAGGGGARAPRAGPAAGPPPRSGGSRPGRRGAAAGEGAARRR